MFELSFLSYKALIMGLLYIFLYELLMIWLFPEENLLTLLFPPQNPNPEIHDEEVIPTSVEEDNEQLSEEVQPQPIAINLTPPIWDMQDEEEYSSSAVASEISIGSSEIEDIVKQKDSRIKELECREIHLRNRVRKLEKEKALWLTSNGVLLESKVTRSLAAVSTINLLPRDPAITALQEVQRTELNNLRDTLNSSEARNDALQERNLYLEQQSKQDLPSTHKLCYVDRGSSPSQSLETSVGAIADFESMESDKRSLFHDDTEEKFSEKAPDVNFQESLNPVSLEADSGTEEQSQSVNGHGHNQQDSYRENCDDFDEDDGNDNDDDNGDNNNTGGNSSITITSQVFPYGDFPYRNNAYRNNEVVSSHVSIIYNPVGNQSVRHLPAEHNYPIEELDIALSEPVAAVGEGFETISSQILESPEGEHIDHNEISHNMPSTDNAVYESIGLTAPEEFVRDGIMTSADFMMPDPRYYGVPPIITSDSHGPSPWDFLDPGQLAQPTFDTIPEDLLPVELSLSTADNDNMMGVTQTATDNTFMNAVSQAFPGGDDILDLSTITFDSNNNMMQALSQAAVEDTSRMEITPAEADLYNLIIDDMQNLHISSDFAYEEYRPQPMEDTERTIAASMEGLDLGIEEPRDGDGLIEIDRVSHQIQRDLLGQEDDMQWGRNYETEATAATHQPFPIQEITDFVEEDMYDIRDNHPEIPGPPLAFTFPTENTRNPFAPQMQSTSEVQQSRLTEILADFEAAPINYDPRFRPGSNFRDPNYHGTLTTTPYSTTIPHYSSVKFLRPENRDRSRLLSHVNDFSANQMTPGVQSSQDSIAVRDLDLKYQLPTSANDLRGRFTFDLPPPQQELPSAVQTYGSQPRRSLFPRTQSASSTLSDPPAVIEVPETMKAEMAKGNVSLDDEANVSATGNNNCRPQPVREQNGVIGYTEEGLNPRESLLSRVPTPPSCALRAQEEDTYLGVPKSLIRRHWGSATEFRVKYMKLSKEARAKFKYPPEVFHFGWQCQVSGCSAGRHKYYPSRVEMMTHYKDMHEMSTRDMGDFVNCGEYNHEQPPGYIHVPDATSDDEESEAETLIEEEYEVLWYLTDDKPSQPLEIVEDYDCEHIPNQRDSLEDNISHNSPQVENFHDQGNETLQQLQTSIQLTVPSPTPERVTRPYGEAFDGEESEESLPRKAMVPDVSETAAGVGQLRNDRDLTELERTILREGLEDSTQTRPVPPLLTADDSQTANSLPEDVDEALLFSRHRRNTSSPLTSPGVLSPPSMQSPSEFPSPSSGEETLSSTSSSNDDEGDAEFEDILFTNYARDIIEYYEEEDIHDGHRSLDLEQQEEEEEDDFSRSNRGRPVRRGNRRSFGQHWVLEDTEGDHQEPEGEKDA